MVDATDPCGVSVSPTTLSVDEGSSATYTVVLDSRPTGNVTVTPAVGGEPKHRLALGLGWRLEGARSRGAGFELRLEGSRHDSVNDNPPENRVGLTLSARW